MRNHIICLLAKHFFRIARYMQFITYIKFIIHIYKICVLVLDAITSSFKELFKNAFVASGKQPHSTGRSALCFVTT